MSLLNTPICCRSCYLLQIPEDLTIMPKCSRQIKLPTIKQSCKVYKYNIAKMEQFNNALVYNHAKYIFDEVHPSLYSLRKLPIFSRIYTKRLAEYIKKYFTD